MEKFGIFELLDALSALTETDEKPEPAPPRTPDGAFSAPDYGLGEAPLPAGTGNAVDGFLTRHEAARKRVKK